MATHSEGHDNTDGDIAEAAALIGTPDLEQDTAEHKAVAISSTKLSVPKEAPVAREARESKAAPRVGKAMQELTDSDEMSLRDYISSLAGGDAFKLTLTRKEPINFPDATGKMVSTAGFLRDYNELIDENQIRDEHGGGLYQIKIMKQSDKGSWQYAKARNIRITGDPRTDTLTRNQPLGVAPQQQQNKGEAQVMTAALDVLKENARQKPEGMPPAMGMLLEQMREDGRRRDEQHREEMKRRDAELAALRAETQEERKAPQKMDTFKDQMITTMMDKEGARLEAIRTQHQAELGILKEGHRQDLERINDRHDRATDRQEKQHERALTTLVENHKRELDMLKMSKDNEIAMMKSSSDTAKQIFQSDKTRLEKENDRLTDENKELRAKKEKSIIETLKDVDVIKKHFGADDDKEPSSTADKLVEAAPMIMEQVGGMVSRVMNRNQPQQAPVQAAPPPPPRPRIVKDQAGNTFRTHNNQLIPVRKAGQRVAIPAADGQVQEVEIPRIDPEKVAFAVNYMERAFVGGTDPDVLSISIKPLIPEEILTAIHTLGGIDQFMIRVAKLPGSSPLASQAGKNWVRKVGKALVGE